MSGPHCANWPLGLTNLLDLGTGTYDPTGTAPHQGGLYPGGSNFRPFAHEQEGRRIAALVEPLDAQGNPSPTGVVGLAVLGPSFAKKIGAQLLLQMYADPLKWDRLAPVNCGSPGRDSIQLSQPSNGYWTTEVPAALSLAGVDARQVQVAWMMAGTQFGTQPWPASVGWLEGVMVACVQNAKAFFPNLKQLYITSPHYEGYSTANPVPEPVSYENAFSVKELVEAQIANDPALNFGNPQSPVLAPWLSWGGYFWTDGATPRVWDGLTLVCPADVEPNGGHTSIVGSSKLAAKLIAEWIADACARPWYTGIPNPTSGAPEDPGPTGKLAP